MFLNIVCECEEDSKWRKRTTTKTNTPKKSLPVVCAREQQPVRGERRNVEQKCWIYTIYVFLALALLSLLPVPTYIDTICKKEKCLLQWKRHIFLLSLLPSLLQERKKTKLMSLSPFKTRLWSIFIRYNSNKQNVLDEIIHNDATRNCTKICWIHFYNL